MKIQYLTKQHSSGLSPLPKTSVKINKDNSGFMNLSDKNNIGLSTTVGDSTNGRVSFKGKFTDAVLQNKTAHKIILGAKNNPLLAEALFALVITCGLRPITILATAGKDPEDKEKCKVQVAKSFSTGIVGLLATQLMTKPFSEAVGTVSKNGFKLPKALHTEAEQIALRNTDLLEATENGILDRVGYHVRNLRGEIIPTTIENIVNTKGAKEELKEKAPEIFEKVKDAISAQKSVNKYRSTMKEFLNKIICPVFSPLKAAITIALVPIILNLIFKNKNSAPAPKQNVQPFSFGNNMPEVFKTFKAGGNN